MQSVTKNGITITFPDDIKPGQIYNINYSVSANARNVELTTDFWVISKKGAKVKITITQKGKIIVS